jgi:hypothetical protein
MASGVLVTAALTGDPIDGGPAPGISVLCGAFPGGAGARAAVRSYAAVFVVVVVVAVVVSIGGPATSRPAAFGRATASFGAPPAGSTAF